MSEQQKIESNLDERIASYLGEQSNRFSRRSGLMKIGRILLRLSGLTLIPLLPVDRRFVVSAQYGCNWQTCGMCGVLCNTCCNNSGGYSKCPTCSGMVTASAWGACCYEQAGDCSGNTFLYSDCCTQNSNDAQSCKGTACQTACYPNFPAYCSTIGTWFYSCTIVTVSGTC